MDCKLWRVTVYMRDDKINYIEQEVEILLPDTCQHGTDFLKLLTYAST